MGTAVEPWNLPKLDRVAAMEARTARRWSLADGVHDTTTPVES